MGTWKLHASSHRLGYYIYIFAKTYCQENEVLKIPDLREKDAVLDSRSWVCTHTWCSMWKSVSYSPERKRHTTLWNSWQFLWQAQWIWWKVFLSKARQHPGVPCQSLKFSSQLPASFLEEVVPVGMHTLQAWKNNKIVRPRLVASTVKMHWVRCLETWKPCIFKPENPKFFWGENPQTPFRACVRHWWYPCLLIATVKHTLLVWDSLSLSAW